MKKKGIELSINVLVVIILSIFLLIMGVAFFRNLLTGADKIKKSYDQRTAEELENLLTQGERVAIPFTRKDIRKGNTIVFGLGIYNMLGHNSYFKVDVQCSTAFVGTTEYSYYCNLFTGGNNLLYNQMDLEIKNNKRHKMPIVITIPSSAQVATYIFNVCVCEGDPNPECYEGGSSTTCEQPLPDNLYDALHKIYVTVK